MDEADCCYSLCRFLLQLSRTLIFLLTTSRPLPRAKDPPFSSVARVSFRASAARNCHLEKWKKKMSKRFLLVTTLTTIVQTRLIVPGDIAPFDISTGVTDVEAIIKSNCEYGNSLPFRILEREFSRGSVGTIYKKKKKKGVEKFLRIHARCCNINTMSKVRLIVGAIKKKKKKYASGGFFIPILQIFRWQCREAGNN